MLGPDCAGLDARMGQHEFDSDDCARHAHAHGQQQPRQRRNTRHHARNPHAIHPRAGCRAIAANRRWRWWRTKASFIRRIQRWSMKFSVRKKNSRAGIALVMVMIAIAVFSILAAGMW